MDPALGIAIAIFSFAAWVSQFITAISPSIAETVGIMDSKEDVDPKFYASLRTEAFWGSLILWVLPVSGVLVALQNENWIYFGVIGGVCLFIFAFRGIVTRVLKHKQGIKIGKFHNMLITYVFCVLWAVLGAIVAVYALQSLI